MFLEKWKKGKPQKIPMGISEKNETKASHRITFRTSNNINGSFKQVFAFKHFF